MAWVAYELTYRAASPVLLGTHLFGFIQRTRYYAPGWTLWGAITAQLTRARLAKAEGADYEAVGKFVCHNVLTSYAAILVDGQPLALPHFKDGDWWYGNLRAADFEARYVTSLGQTAIAPTTVTAETGSLHEAEALAAHDLKCGQRVHWRLTLYLRQPWRCLPTALCGLTQDDVRGALHILTLGANRNYGLGRLELDGSSEALCVCGDEWPRPLGWSQGQPTQAHVAWGDLDGHVVRGNVEAVPWRWWSNAKQGDDGWGAGQQVRTRLFYAPGARVEGESWQPVVGPQGVWQTEGAVHDII